MGVANATGIMNLNGGIYIGGDITLATRGAAVSSLGGETGTLNINGAAVMATRLIVTDSLNSTAIVNVNSGVLTATTYTN